MNRRQKIIVSVTGIFLVLLILVGLTYAYFLTRIDGNDANKSISVTTANLALTYSDGNGELTFANAIVPGESIKFKKSDGTVVNEKTFSVTNSGDDTEYVVFIDDISITKDGTPTTFESNDFRFTLTCTITSTDSTRNNTNCNSVEKGVFPLINESSLVGNKILKGDVHNYTLTMEYIETGRNQSNDMNKSLTALINIEDINRLNPYNENIDSLAYNIINNSIHNEKGTILKIASQSQPGTAIKKVWGKETKLYENYNEYWWEGNVYYGDTEEEAINYGGLVIDDFVTEYDESSKALCEALIGKHIALYERYDYATNTEIFNYLGKVVKCADNGAPYLESRYEQVLTITQDDYGTSYYYRGAVEDNYVNFAGMCWRILRIQGDGSVKLILDDKNTTCNDDTDTDGDGTEDYAYTGNYAIGSGNYGYSTKTINNDTFDIVNYLEPVTNADKSMVKAFYDFQTTGKLKDYTGSLKVNDWCLNDTNIELDGQLFDLESAFKADYGYFDFPKATVGFICPGRKVNEYESIAGVSEKSNMYVGAITLDEEYHAGGVNGYAGGYTDYYLNKNATAMYWTSSLAFTDSGEYTDYTINAYYQDGGIYDYKVIGTNSFRPVVSLKKDIELAENSGNGGRLNPYIIN